MEKKKIYKNKLIINFYINILTILDFHYNVKILIIFIK